MHYTENPWGFDRGKNPWHIGGTNAMDFPWCTACTMELNSMGASCRQKPMEILCGEFP